MKFIIRPRRAGKTTEAIRLAVAHNAIIVSGERHECYLIEQLAKQLGYRIQQPLTVDEFIHGHFYNRKGESFVIDNLELLLERPSKGLPIIAVTMSCYDECDAAA